MKSVIPCVFFFVAAWALPMGEEELQFDNLYVDPLENDIPVDSRITRGREAVPHSIPYQAYVMFSTSKGTRSLCGGSLISPRHVLTAGHCVNGKSSATVYLGSHNIIEAESTRVIVQSKKLIRHEDYNATAISDDIGLVVLDRPVELNEYVNVVSLPSREVTTDYEGFNARVSGWGRLTGDGTTSAVLMEVNSTVISNTSCRQIFRIVIDSQLCISGKGGVGSCKGDSGGPLVANNNQIGIVSYGATGCKSGVPSGFTRVTSYLDWIEENTGLTF